MLALGVWLVLSSCWSSGRQDDGESGTSGEGGQGGTSGAAGIGGMQASGSDAVATMDGQSDSSYRVSVRADDTTLCPGECTTLLAEVENGTAPFSYAWNQTGMEGEGPFEVCPSQTTSYEVSATDSFSSLEEFGGDDREATGAMQIIVTTTCDEPGEVDLPPINAAPGQPICELRIASDATTSISVRPSWGAHKSMSVDAQGNLYFVATTSGGTLRVGETTIDAGGEHVDGLVVKLSPACEPVWLKPLRTRAGSFLMSAVAVSPSGQDIYVAGVLEGSASFAGETFEFAGDDTGFLLRLDGEGEVVWAEPARGPSITQLNDLALADNGDVIVTGFGLEGATFAGLSGAMSSSDYVAFVARVRPDGVGTFLHEIPHSNENLSVTTLPSGSLALLGWGTANAPLELAGGVIAAPIETWSMYVAVLEAGGDFVWGRSVRTSDERWTSFDGTTMAITRAGTLLLDHSHYIEDASGTLWSTEPELIELDDAGTELWSIERPYARGSDFFWSGGIAVDSDDHILVLDQVFDGAASEGGGTFATNGASDVVLNKLTADGEPIWNWQTGSADQDWFWGVATDRQDAIWVGSGSVNLETNASELVITRIAP
jgi:hypothetical protein